MLKPCTGEAHRNPFIDNCMRCMPRWGFILVKEPKPTPANAGFVSTKANRYVPGGWLTVYRSAEAGMESDPDPSLRYSVVCETHSTLVCVGSKRVAASLTTVEFCDDCRALACEDCSAPIATHSLPDPGRTALCMRCSDARYEGVRS